MLPSSGPAVQSLPKSPDRPGSTSPFAPSAADLPGMPEPALTSRANTTGKDPQGLVRVTGSRTEALGEESSQSGPQTRPPTGTGRLHLRVKQGRGGLQGVEGIREHVFHLNRTTGLQLLATQHETRPSVARSSDLSAESTNLGFYIDTVIFKTLVKIFKA